jgi:shikimate kinase
MNVTLIGMSGVGKSRIGQLLAQKLHFGFVDIDRLMEKNSGKKLQELVDCLGDEKFMQLEERDILSIKCADNMVISPGGSSIYSEQAMKYLKSISTVVFLSASLEEIKRRTPDFSKRGIVGLKQKGLDRLFLERLPLYIKYADLTIDVTDCSDQSIVEMLIEKVIEQ